MRALLIAGVLTLAAATAVSARPNLRASDDTVGVVTITANDFAFVGPDTIAAGLTTVRLQNRGTELHHIQLIRLDQGKTLADLFAALKAGGAPPAWAYDVGGPNTPPPGGDSQASLRLAPGRYAMLCWIPSPDGVPHVMKGMAKELTVVPASRAAKGSKTAAPAPDVTVTLKDYDFVLSKPLVAGKHVIRVHNEAAQPHEIVIARLEPGRSAADLVSWIDKPAGPPPGMPVGGTTAMAKSEENFIEIDLPAGDYALICFIPDAGDGKPHLAHGMMKQIVIK